MPSTYLDIVSDRLKFDREIANRTGLAAELIREAKAGRISLAIPGPDCDHHRIIAATRNVRMPGVILVADDGNDPSDNPMATGVANALGGAVLHARASAAGDGGAVSLIARSVGIVCVVATAPARAPLWLQRIKHGWLVMDERGQHLVEPRQ